VRDSEQRRDERVTPALLEHTLARIDEDEREVGGRCAGHHVARVLDVTRCVGDDELPLRRREVAVGDVDGDALLALGAQVRSTASSWSSKIDFVSYSRRPMSVDFPSSTLPAVASRRSSDIGESPQCEGPIRLARSARSADAVFGRTERSE
jgi:hypothetical protein